MHRSHPPLGLRFARSALTFLSAGRARLVWQSGLIALDKGGAAARAGTDLGRPGFFGMGGTAAPPWLQVPSLMAWCIARQAGSVSCVLALC